MRGIHEEAARGRGVRRVPPRGAAVGAGGAAGGGVGVSSPSSIDGGARPAAARLAPHGRPPARSAGGGAASSTRMAARALGRRRAGGPACGRAGLQEERGGADRRASRGDQGGQKGPYGNTVGEETRSYVCNWAPHGVRRT
ncbi:hypothetical protein PVAP13_3NG141283 [Panicum virgatum]|uniref:Uncharacterized protein n=1 Tax=Panicum virgatum TaxID=38727 RepID=A0A8T0TZI6_PANVG|nr:hypothetical protein PVAP13_3NG141283 [Panicum virgatum]